MAQGHQTIYNPDRAPVRFRKLRIAFSVVCGIVLVLLIALWVRSYWWGESLTVQINNTWSGCSDLRGSFVLTCFDATQRTDIRGGYSWGPAPGQRLDEDLPVNFYGFCFKKSTDGFGVVAPAWFLMLVSVGCAVAPWLNWRRFTTRSLLIATTLFAAVLGLAVYLSK